MRKSDSVVKQQKASSHLSGLEIVLNQMVTIDRSRTMEELNRAIQGILEYRGEYTKAGRAYTFEFIEKQSIYRNTSEWCAEGVKPQIVHQLHPEEELHLVGSLIVSLGA